MVEDCLGSLLTHLGDAIQNPLTSWLAFLRTNPLLLPSLNFKDYADLDFQCYQNRILKIYCVHLDHLTVIEHQQHLVA